VKQGQFLMNKNTRISILLAASFLSSNSAFSQTAASASNEDPSAANTEITVTATGVTRGDLAGGLMVRKDATKTVSTVTADFIQKQDPATDVFQLIKFLPGANTASADPYNLNSGQITVHGLDSTQMGFSQDGAPIQVESGGSVFPGQWLDNENTETVTLTQGSADLASPFTGALGGIVDVRLRQPSKTFGGLVDLSIGSESAKRAFLRVDTGYIGNTGIRAFVSGSVINAEHFRGPGKDNKKVVNAAIMKDFDDGSFIKLSASYVFLNRDTYLNPTLAQYQAGGAKGPAANRSGTYTYGNTAYYKLNANPWNNLITSAPSHFNIADNVHLDVTPYFYYGFGRSGGAGVFDENSIGFGASVVSADLNGNGVVGDKNVIVYTPFFERTQRYGVVNSLKVDAGINEFVLGYWFQWAKDQLFRVLAPVAANGSPVDIFGLKDRFSDTAGNTIFNVNQITRSTTNAVFAGDTIKLDRLTFNVGGKMVWETRKAFNDLPDPTNRFKIERHRFLPSAGVRFDMTPESQFFASVATGFRVPAENALANMYDETSGTLVQRANPNQASETSFMQEIGYRYQGPMVDLTLSGFHYIYRNRQISTTVCDTTCYSQSINGGDQRGQGVDLEVGFRGFHHFRPYVSAEFLDTTNLSNLPSGNDFLPTRGKNAIRAPRVQTSAAVDYDDGTFFGNVGAKYTGKQYATFMNDQQIKGFTVVDAAIGFRLKNIAFVKAPELRLNVRNLFDKDYLSGVSGPTTNAVATTGINGTAIGASAPTFYVASGRSLLLTLAVGF
jgi:iron complex outermembrane receptor protein